MNTPHVFEFLNRITPGRVFKNRSLADYSTWRIGGSADWVVEPSSIDEVVALQKFVAETGLPSVVIGDGSNMLFDDAGFRGIVMHIGRNLSRFSLDTNGTAFAEAGLWTPIFVSRVARAGFAGCAHAIGVPGTIGGLVVMNGGTARKGIGEQLVEATVVTSTGKVEVLSNDDCGFAYRTSTMQKSGAIVVAARFHYEKGDPKALRHEMIQTLMERNRKFPRKTPNCGSVFLSNPKLYAEVGAPGKAIEEAGMKGAGCGDAQVSSLHANFIVNLGHATSADVLRLISRVRAGVHARTGHKLECEVRHLLPNGLIQPAHISAESVAHA